MHIARFLIVTAAFLLISACGASQDAQLLRDVGEPIPGTGSTLSLHVEGFAVPAVVLDVRDEDVLLFEYPDMDATLADLERISQDGLRIGETALPWTPPIHVFATATQIAVYRGNNLEILDLLASQGGPQIWGDPVPVRVEVEEQTTR